MAQTDGMLCANESMQHKKYSAMYSGAGRSVGTLIKPPASDCRSCVFPF